MKPRWNRSGSFEHLKSLLLLSVLLLVGFKTTATPEDAVERISRNELKPLKGAMPGEDGLQREVLLADGVKMTAAIEVTAKGNGLLRIGNLNVKVFDSHNDGSYYENAMLKIEFANLDGDGKRELVISGIVCFTDEKSDKVLRREQIVFIYTLQPNRTFKQMYRNTEMQIDSLR